MKRISYWTLNLDKMNIPHEDTVREDAPFKLTVEEPVTSSCREEDSLTADASDLETKPNYLVAFHVTTAGKQQEEHRSDEYPVVLITAKLIDLENPQSKSPEFEAYIRPVRHLIAECSDRSTDEVTGDTGPLCCPLTQSVVVVPLTEECRIATGLTDAMLADAGTLEEALEQFDRWLHVQGLSNDDIATFDAKLTGMPLKYADKQRRGETTELATTGSGSQCPHTLSTTRSCFSKISGYTQPMVLLTDGPTDLRLLLHPEATVQSVDLTQFPYLYHYIDVKKEYKRIFQKGSGSTSITEMLTYAERSMECLTNEANRIPQECQSRSLESLPMESDSTKGSEFAGCADMVYETCEVSGSRSNRNAPLQPMEEIRFPPALSSRRSLPIQHCRKLAELACYMTSQGCEWNHVETIQMSYQPAILRKTEVIAENTVARARGLPWQANDLDVFRFFSGLNIADGGICLMLSKIGRRNGEALIRFTDPEQRELALCRHKHHMGQRYIEVYGAHSQEFIAFATTETSEAEEFLKRFVSPRQTLVRMRGLPYSVNAEQILQFFDNNHCSVQFGSDGILFVNRPDGRASGDAFVMFETNEVAERALKSHRQHIGNRYIELFKSTPAEVNQVLNATVRQEVTCPKRWIGLSGNAESSSNGILPSTVPYIDGVRELLSTYASTVRTEPPCGLANRFSLPSLHAYPTGNNLLGSQNLTTGLHHLDSFGSAYMPALVSMYSMLSPQPVLPKAFNAGVFPYACDTFWLNPYSSVPGVQLNTGHQWGRYPQVQKDPSYTIAQRAAPLMEDIVIPTVRDDTFPVMPVGMDQLAKCFIRIRGMPLEADILDILTFVGDAWRSIVVHGVHLVYNSLGRSNGEAIIQFVSEKAAQWMIEQKHGSIFFKRTAQTVTSSFVEVIQCTAEDVTQLMYTVAALVQANIHTAKPLHGGLQQMSFLPAIFNPLDIHVNPTALPYFPYHGSEVILNSLGLPGIVTSPCSHMNMQFAARSTHPIGPMYTPANNRTEVFIGATPPISIATELPMHDASVNHMTFIPVQTNTANPPTVLQQPLGAFGQANPALFQQNPMVSGLVLPQPGVNSNVCQPYTTMGYGNSTNASLIQTESQKAELAHPFCESVNQKLLEIKPDSSTDGQSPRIRTTEPGLPRIPKQGAPHEKVGQTGRVEF